MHSNDRDTPFPPQRQDQPGVEEEMTPQPESGEKEYVGCGKLQGKKALITGGDSGIGRAVAIAFAREGADVAFAYLSEEQDARQTRGIVERAGVRCLSFRGDVGDEQFCRRIAVRDCREVRQHRHPGQQRGGTALRGKAGGHHAPSSWSGLSAPTSSPTSS